MPDPNWLKIRFPLERWSTAHTANVTIGQGYVLTSPLQMAVAYAALANGGTIYEPRLVKKVLDSKGRPVRVNGQGEVINLDDPNLTDKGTVAWPEQPKIRADLRKELTEAQIEQVRKGLWKVVNESGGSGGGGTGGKARNKNYVAAGKTGTAQATDRGKKDTIAWFCEFAPYDKPRYAICTMVQGGNHGGSVAAPIAAHIMEQLISMDQGNLKVELTKLDPARGKTPLREHRDADRLQECRRHQARPRGRDRRLQARRGKIQGANGRHRGASRHPPRSRRSRQAEGPRRGAAPGRSPELLPALLRPAPTRPGSGAGSFCAAKSVQPSAVRPLPHHLSSSSSSLGEVNEG